mmetsp:Transcript_385/g.1097  ORF Transcript_385/g.1097 Transcript_385/m.1097 type:complete len:135 (-) Transcript_385:142-546(-)
MEVVKKFLQEQLPAYLQKLPLPDTFEGWTKLTGEQWLDLAPLLATLLALVLVHVMLLLGGSSAPRSSAWVNKKLRKDQEKVVDRVSVDDISGSKKNPVAFCRCYKSSTFPYCDGSHNSHNKETGDNAGPLVVEH